MARDPKPWRQAALGGALMTLGAILFGATRKPADPPAAPQRSRRRQGREAADAASAGTAPPPVRTRHWPPRDAASDPGSSEDGAPSRALPVDAQSAKLGYEVGDTRVAALATVMVVSVAAIAISVSGLFFLIGRIHRIDARSPPLTPQQTAVLVPPGPHLQGDPLADIAAERKREHDLLDRYAWVDPAHGRARIPIERAMQIVIGRPLAPAGAKP